MPIVIDVDAQRRAIVLTATDRLTGDELVTANEGFLRTHIREFRDCRTWLSDFTQANLDAVDMHHLRSLGQISVEAAKQNRGLFVAIATSPDLSFGLGRTWEGLATATGGQTMVFRSRVQAQQWLDKVAAEGDAARSPD